MKNRTCQAIAKTTKKPCKNPAKRRSKWCAQHQYPSSRHSEPPMPKRPETKDRGPINPPTNNPPESSINSPLPQGNKMAIRLNNSEKNTDSKELGFWLTILGLLLTFVLVVVFLIFIW